MEMIESLVSIIVPIYNKEYYLDKCLNSLKKQIYKNIEVLMIDDGSIDSSREICKKYKDIDKRFKYIYQKNSGVSIARNLGMQSSKGEWIMFVDPDDYVDVSLVNTLFSKVEKDIDIISCCCMADCNGKLILNEFYESDYIFNRKDDVIELNMLLMDEQYKSKYTRFTAIGVPWGKLYRKDMLDKNHIRFDNDLKRMQDNIFNMYAFDKSRKIRYINKPLYIYSCDNIMIINQKYDPEVINYYDKIVKIRKSFLIEKELMKIDSIKEAFYKETYKLLTIMIRKYFLHDNNKDALIDKVKKIKKFIGKDEYDTALNYSNLKKYCSKSEKIKIILLKEYTYLYALLFKYKNSKKYKY